MEFFVYLHHIRNILIETNMRLLGSLAALTVASANEVSSVHSKLKSSVSRDMSKKKRIMIGSGDTIVGETLAVFFYFFSKFLIINFIFIVKIKEKLNEPEELLCIRVKIFIANIFEANIFKANTFSFDHSCYDL